MVEILHAIGELAATKSFERLDALCQTDIVALPTAEKITLAGALIDKINEVDDQLADFNLEVIRTGLRGGSWEPTPEKQALLNLDDALLTALTYSLMPQTDEERTVFAHDNLWPKLSSLAMGEYSKKKTAYPPSLVWRTVALYFGKQFHGCHSARPAIYGHRLRVGVIWGIDHIVSDAIYHASLLDTLRFISENHPITREFFEGPLLDKVTRTGSF